MDTPSLYQQVASLYMLMDGRSQTGVRIDIKKGHIVNPSVFCCRISAAVSFFVKRVVSVA
jgi:hypothetical protein